ncbi:hypothetical protein N8D56_10760 [Devosia sp. A8/3-2]|nr:hypothetical protein N8D56_10760 [Devosia sp. A8/3-2]
MEGAEILGGDIHAGQFAQIVIDGAGLDRPDLAALIAIDQQALARQLLDSTQRGSRGLVGKAVIRPLAALGCKAHADLVPLNLHVARKQCSGAARTTGFKIFFAAHPHRRLVDQGQGNGEGQFTAAGFCIQPGQHLSPQLGQYGGQHRKPLELAAIPLQFPIGMIDILIAPGFIDPKRLNMATRISRDPHILPEPVECPAPSRALISASRSFAPVASR